MLLFRSMFSFCCFLAAILTGLSSFTSADNIEAKRLQQGCIYPNVPDKVTTYISAVENASKSGQAYEFIEFKIVCDQKYVLTGNSTVACYYYEGVDIWNPPKEKIPKCVPACDLPKHVSVDYDCADGINGFSACGEAVPVGTLVRPRCRHNYYAPTTNPYMRCGADGWNYIAICDPECGTLTPSSTQISIGGRLANRTDVPWQAAIYTKLVIPHNQICGGTLISKSVVLSAAHCFWNSGKLPAEHFAVAVGKLYRLWTDARDDAQKSDVKAIYLDDYFSGPETNYQADIAVVVVSTPFTYQEHIRPVCLDFDKTFQNRQFAARSVGKVAGWGLASVVGGSSPVLRMIDMPYVDIKECLAAAPPQFRHFITTGKICAGFLNANKSLCLGDSGGGLVFASEEKGTIRHYLRGIASATANNKDVQCDPQFYNVFTEIMYYEYFIKKYWDTEHAPMSDRQTGKTLEYEKEEPNCRYNPSICSPDATCLKDHFLTYTCRCNNGYSGNGFRCHLNDKPPGNWLIVSAEDTIYRVPLPYRALPSAFNTEVFSKSNDFNLDAATEVDCLTGRVFWTDKESHTINWATNDGSFHGIFLQDVTNGEGITIDWLARNIYWTDGGEKTVEMASLDTKDRRVVATFDERTQLCGIVVHPQRGKLFWGQSTTGDPKIEWADLDGSDRKTFFDKSKVLVPSSFAIDWETDRLCYTDMGRSEIACVNIDTLKVDIIVQSVYPFSLAIIGNKFYWTDWLKLSVEYLDVGTGFRGEYPQEKIHGELTRLSLSPAQCPALQPKKVTCNTPIPKCECPALPVSPTSSAVHQPVLGIGFLSFIPLVAVLCDSPGTNVVYL